MMRETEYSLEHIILISIVEFESENEFWPRIRIDPLLKKYEMKMKEIEFYEMVRSLKQKIRDCFNKQYSTLYFVVKQIGQDESIVDLCIFGEKKANVYAKKKQKMASNC